MNSLFINNEEKEKIEVQLDKIGFDISYKENEGNIIATLTKTERFKSQSFDLESFKNTLKNRTEPYLLEGKTISIEYA